MKVYCERVHFPSRTNICITRNSTNHSIKKETWTLLYLLISTFCKNFRLYKSVVISLAKLRFPDKVGASFCLGNYHDLGIITKNFKVIVRQDIFRARYVNNSILCSTQQKEKKTAKVFCIFLNFRFKVIVWSEQWLQLFTFWGQAQEYLFWEMKL